MLVMLVSKSEKEAAKNKSVRNAMITRKGPVSVLPVILFHD